MSVKSTFLSMTMTYRDKSISCSEVARLFAKFDGSSVSLPDNFTFNVEPGKFYGLSQLDFDYILDKLYQLDSCIQG